MKRLIWLAALVLLLAGCAREATEQTTTQGQPSVPTEPTGWYDPDSLVEKTTNGSVREYDLDKDYTDMTVLDGKLVMVSQSGELTYLEGDICEPAQTVVTGGTVIAFSENGIACYAQDKKTVLLLDAKGKQTQSIQLPEDILGLPAVSLESGQVYYCTEGAIRALDMGTGISRLVKEHSYEALTLNRANAALIDCAAGDKALYLSAQTGQVLYEGTPLDSVQLIDQQYLVQRMDGVTQELIFGTLEGENKLLDVAAVDSVLFLGEQAVCVRVDAQSALQMEIYSLTDGLRTAQVTAPETALPEKLLAKDGCIWFMSEKKLYRWEPAKTPVTDETVYVGTLYTADAPDENGLDDCENRAAVLKKHYGVRFRLWEECLKTTGGHTFVPEHQVDAINGVLGELESVFELFPDYFLYGTVDSGWLRLCIVRSIDGERTYTQYWADNDCYIVICPGVNVREAFLRGLSYAVDAHVIGNSRDLDEWNERYNPKGFEYSLDADSEITDTKYLEGENRAFVDDMSMRFPTEDRARLFYAAMCEGNEELFKSDYMQAKLKRLCTGIREAYGLDKKTDTYLWEQYLTESLAYQKKK